MENQIKCVIIDDEPLARELIKSYVYETPTLSLKGSFESAAEAIKTVMSGDIDIVFLDINMPMLNGIEFARVIPQRTRIIYITAYEQYALQGFRVNALDYLLKPVNFPEFTRAVGKALEWVAMRDSYESSGNGRNADSRGRNDPAPSSDLPLRNAGREEITSSSRNRNDFLTIRADSRLIQMRTDSILYIEAQNDRVVFYRKGADPISSLVSLKEVEELLSAERFMRVHRSFIVNLDNIEIVERNRIIFGKTYIPIADSRRDDFFARFTGH